MLRGREYLRRWCAGSAVIIALLWCLPSSARADQPENAPSASVALSERRAAEAFQAYSKDDFALAVALYLDAYKAAPSGSILYNIARIYDTKLVNHAQAITFYQRYLTAPGTHPELVQIANQRLRELREGELTSPLSLEARSPLAGDQLLRERASPHAPPGSRPARPPARSDGWSPLRWMGVGAGAVGLVGIGVGTWFGLSAMSGGRTANEWCDGNACSSQAGVDAAQAARSDATISSLAFGAGIPLLATGVALFFVGTRERSSPPTAPTSSRSATSRASTRASPRENTRWEAAPTASGWLLRISGGW